MSSATTTVADAPLWWLDASDPADVDAATIGSKAANLVRMANAGLAVPPGFVLPTSVCAAYDANGGIPRDQIEALVERGIGNVEQRTGRRFGAQRRPLLLSVRSGAAVSMPGMLDTLLDVGLCDVTLTGLLRDTGDPVFVWDTYRRLVQSYAVIVEGCAPDPFDAVVNDAVRRVGCPDVSELDVAALRGVVEDLRQRYLAMCGRPFPQDPVDQLVDAVDAVLRSWGAPRAVEYRRLQRLEHLSGTAVTVQAMVFGNRGATSGAGVGFTRDPATGERRLYVDFVIDAQGEDVVGGRRTALDSGPSLATIPGLGERLEDVAGTLESLFGDAQDFEFTVEEGDLWLLQTRTAKRTPWAALQIACDLVGEGVIDEATASDRLSGYDLDSVVRRRPAPGPDAEPVGHATPASSGTATGRVALDVAAARQLAAGGPVVLVRAEASTDDVAGLAVCRGLLTASGARTAHAAVVARQLGVVCLVGCRDLVIDPATRALRLGARALKEGDTITLAGTDGTIYAGAVPTVEERPTELVARVRAWQPAARGFVTSGPVAARDGGRHSVHGT